MKDSESNNAPGSGVLSTDRLQEIFDQMDEADQNVMTLIAHDKKTAALSVLGAMIVKGQQSQDYAATPKFMLVQ